jgi:hypothetical protein
MKGVEERERGRMGEGRRKKEGRKEKRKKKVFHACSFLSTLGTRPGWFTSRASRILGRKVAEWGGSKALNNPAIENACETRRQGDRMGSK